MKRNYFTNYPLVVIDDLTSVERKKNPKKKLQNKKQSPINNRNEILHLNINSVSLQNPSALIE